MIEIRLLEHAVALADQGSFAVAAQTLNISQSALTRSIQALEAELGLQVFERGHRRIEPTDAGQVTEGYRPFPATLRGWRRSTASFAAAIGHSARPASS